MITSYPATSQVGAAARLNQVAMLLSEDFDSNAALDGVRFIRSVGVRVCAGELRRFSTTTGAITNHA